MNNVMQLLNWTSNNPLLALCLLAFIICLVDSVISRLRHQD